MMATTTWMLIVKIVRSSSANTLASRIFQLSRISGCWMRLESGHIIKYYCYVDKWLQMPFQSGHYPVVLRAGNLRDQRLVILPPTSKTGKIARRSWGKGENLLGQEHLG